MPVHALTTRSLPTPSSRIPPSESIVNLLSRQMLPGRLHKVNDTSAEGEPPNAMVSATDLTSAGGSRRRQDVFRIMVDLVANRILIVDSNSGKPVDKYLISPGMAQFPTRGKFFTIAREIPNPSWTPPNSPWADGLKYAPPGPTNPMGVLKLDLGGFKQFIHGVPSREYRKLGRPASHGCIRMSNENVLHFYQRYAGVGSRVDIIRDASVSDALAQRFRQAGVMDRALTEGTDLLAPAWKRHMPEPLKY